MVTYTRAPWRFANDHGRHEEDVPGVQWGGSWTNGGGKSVAPQRLQRLHRGRAPRRDIGRDEARAEDHRASASVGNGVEGIEHEQARREDARHGNGERAADGEADGGETERVPQHEADDRSRARAERQADPELLSALGHDVRESAINAGERQEQRDEAERA